MTDKILAVVQSVVFLGFPALMAATLLSGANPVPWHWSSAVAGALYVVLVEGVLVLGWLTWTGRMSR